MEVTQNSKTVEPISTRISEDSDGVLMLRIFKEGRGEIFLEGGQRLPIRNYHSDIRADTQVKDFLVILGFESWDKIKELDVSYLGKYGAVLDYVVLVSEVPSSLEENFVDVAEFGGGADE